MKQFWIILAIIVAFVPLFWAMVLHFDRMCGEGLISEQTSPDNQYVAALMRRNCGATTRYVFHINLRRARSKYHPTSLDVVFIDGEVYTSSDYSGYHFWWSKLHEFWIGYPQWLMRNWLDVTIDDIF